MSNTEKLLTALVEEKDVSDIKCKSRMDDLLKRCCTGDSCNDIKPRNNTEILLKKLNEKMINGGGGGSASVSGEIPISPVVPDSGYIDKIYFNTSLSVEETNAILETLEYVVDPMGSDNLIAVIATNADTSNALFVIKAPNEGYIIASMINGNSNFIFSSVSFTNGEDDEPSGWLASEFAFNDENAIGTLAPQMGVPLQNDKVVDVIHIDVGGKKPVPNTGFVDKVYFNTNLSESEVETILSTLTYSGQEELEQKYILVAGTVENPTYGFIVVASPQIGIYAIGDMTQKAIWANQVAVDYLGAEFGVTTAGWQAGFTNPIEINSEVISEVPEANILIGNENDKLVDLFYMAGEPKTTTETKTLSGTYDGTPITATEDVNMTELLEQRKLPLRINVEGGASIIGYSSTPTLKNIKTLPNTGTITTLGMNVKYTNEQITEILNQIPDEAYTSNEYIVAATEDEELITITKGIQDSKVAYVISYINGFFSYFGDEEFVKSVGAVVGWNENIVKEFSSNPNMLMAINTELSDTCNGIAVGKYNAIINKIIAESWTVTFEKLSTNLFGEYEGTTLDVSGSVSVNPLADLENKKIVTEINVTDSLEIKMKNTGIHHACKYLFYKFEGDQTEWDKLKNLKLKDKFLDGEDMFYMCENLETIPFVLNVDSVSNGKRMFYGCEKCTNIPTVWRSLTPSENMFDDCKLLTEFHRIIPDDGAIYRYSNANASSMFYGCTNLKIVEFSGNRGYDTCGTLRDLYFMFYGCTELESVYGLETTQGTLNNDYNIYYDTFKGCKKLKNLELKYIRANLQVGSGDGTGTDDYGTLLTVDSLVGLCKECVKSTLNNGAYTLTLTVGSANLDKLASVYVKFTDTTQTTIAAGEKGEVEVCESTAEGAMTIHEYMALKYWDLQ